MLVHQPDWLRCDTALMTLDLPFAEFGFPGPLRDRLVAAVLAGTKTSTTGLLAAYESEREALPVAGTRQVVIDSAKHPVAVIETTEVRVVAWRDVDFEHVRDEGEGDATLAEWRVGHTRFFESADMLEVLGDPHFGVRDETPVVLERFRVVQRLDR